MNDIINYIHKFSIEEMEIEITINYINGEWSSMITKGDTGLGLSTGGKFNCLEDYIEDRERQHRYFYAFFNKKPA